MRHQIRCSCKRSTLCTRLARLPTQSRIDQWRVMSGIRLSDMVKHLPYKQSKWWLPERSLAASRIRKSPASQLPNNLEKHILILRLQLQQPTRMAHPWRRCMNNTVQWWKRMAHWSHLRSYRTSWGTISRTVLNSLRAHTVRSFSSIRPHQLSRK